MERCAPRTPSLPSCCRRRRSSLSLCVADFAGLRVCMCVCLRSFDILSSILFLAPSSSRRLKVLAREFLPSISFLAAAAAVADLLCRESLLPPPSLVAPRLLVSCLLSVWQEISFKSCNSVGMLPVCSLLSFQQRIRGRGTGTAAAATASTRQDAALSLSSHSDHLSYSTAQAQTTVNIMYHWLQ